LHCYAERVQARSDLSAAELSAAKSRNKVTAVTTKLQRSNALICFTEHTLKRIENEALPRYANV